MARRWNRSAKCVQKHNLRFEHLEVRALLTTLAGDYTADGVVNIADYLMWRDNLGAMIELANETVTPGTVTSEDYDEWKAHFGQIQVAPVGRAMEKLDRGVVATRTDDSEAFVSWRLLGLDPEGIEFNVYRSQNGGASWSKRNGTPLAGGTNFTDSGVNFSSATIYRVNPVIDGVEQPANGQWTLPANAEEAPLFRIPLKAPHDHWVHQVWPGDADGDGQYELFASLVGTTSGQTQKLVAYKLDGTFLWEVDFGPNSIDPHGVYPTAAAISAGQWDGVTVYDIDSDGQAEVIVKSANGVTFGDGTTLHHGEDVTQFISILNGMTGAEEARAELPNPWKNDNNYPLGTLFGIGYPDGERPSLMIHAKNRTGGGGTPFNTINSAWNYRDGELTNLWSIQWGGYETGAPESSHQMRLVDLDGDGKDELVPGMHAVSSDGTLLWDLHDVGAVHGDRFHVGNLDPNRPGLEMYGVQQNNPNGMLEYVADASTGELLWTVTTDPPGWDVGRAVTADLDPNYPGMEVWAFDGIRSATGEKITDEPNRPWPNLQIWWDGDVLGEVLHRTMLDKWNSGRLLTAWHYGASEGPRDVPAFYGDILGDWREEIVFESGDHSELIVFTTPHSTDTRLYTLAHNPAYRNQMTVKGYVQQNLTDYFLGDGMAPPPTPDIYYTELQVSNSENIYQAEEAVIAGGVSIDFGSSGYNGTGYANFPGTDGSVRWTGVDGGVGGSTTIHSCYALGVTTSRTGSLSINGNSQDITFEPTDAWTAWNTLSLDVPLNPKSSNTVTLESTGQDLANIDQLEVSVVSPASSLQGVQAALVSAAPAAPDAQLAASATSKAADLPSEPASALRETAPNVVDDLLLLRHPVVTRERHTLGDHEATDGRRTGEGPFFVLLDQHQLALEHVFEHWDGLDR